MNESTPTYEQVIGPIEDRMMRSIWRVVRNAQDAEDALQNALLAIWKNWHRVVRHPCAQALVLKICIDAAYDVARRRLRAGGTVQSQDVEELQSAERDPLEEMARRESSEEILAAVRRLSRSQAIAFTLRVCEELPFDEIAAAMGCSAATVRKHVERAHAQLSIALAKHQPSRRPEVRHERS